MTISPPAKVKTGNTDLPQVLCHGIDTLYLNIDVIWQNSVFFEKLTKIKGYAQNSHSDYPLTLYPAGTRQPWKCLIKPHGARGHEWILQGCEFTIRIGNWMEPIAKPSIVVEIRSEALWRLGAQNALKRLLQILEGQRAKFVAIKPNRVDLCTDILIDEDQWNMDLIGYRVTRAAYAAPHLNHHTLTGISIGKGKISARIYDKPLEIKSKSKKIWMYDIWGLDEVPDKKRILRVEYQLRREAVTELGIDKVGHLLRSLDNVWAHCTQKWLKFRSNPGKHHTQRKTLAWWKVVQNGFGGAQTAAPSIRFKPNSIKEDQAFAQIYGNMTSLEASRLESCPQVQKLPIDFDINLGLLKREAELRSKDGFAFADEVETKMAKFQRTNLKMLEVQNQRKQLDQPSNFSAKQLEKARMTQQRLSETRE